MKRFKTEKSASVGGATWASLSNRAENLLQKDLAWISKWQIFFPIVTIGSRQHAFFFRSSPFSGYDNENAGKFVVTLAANDV